MLLPHSLFRIGPRLAASFATLLLLFVALAVGAAARLEDASTTLRQLSADHLENLALVFEIGGHADDATRKLLVLIGSERPQRVSAYGEIDAANRRLDAAMTLLDSRLRDPQRRAEFLLLARKLAAYRHAYGENVDVIEAEDWGHARQLLVGHTEVALSELSSARDALSRSEQDAADAATQDLRDQIQRDRGLLALACAIALALGGGLSWWVTRTIVRPLARAEWVARHMVNGDYSRRVRDQSRDEIGSLSQALNALAGAAGEREVRLRQLAERDALTGLNLRGSFIELGDRLMQADPEQCQVLLCFDIDRLKTINSLLGFDAGDAVIIECARRLRLALPEPVPLGRLTGGTLVALVEVSRPEDGHRLAMALRVALEGEVIFDANPLDLSVSMGLALAPVHAADCEALLRHVESALFEAKRQRVACVVYAPSLEAQRISQLTLLSELNTAVSDNQLRMFLQPKFSVQDSSLQGFEALVRWRHPVRGWVSPAEFIPFAESSGRIRDITRWMLRSAVTQLHDWRTTAPGLWIAVNISTLDLLDNGLPEFIAQVLHGTGVPARLLQLELTESGLMAAGPDPVRTLDTLRHLGLHLAIDDFGTGQSSLAYLQRLPVHELKIDRSFVDGFDTQPRRRSLLGSIVGLGHSLGLTVTAEGVETEAELQALRESGCDLVQGFLLGRPMDQDALSAWMAQRARDAQPPAEPIELATSTTSGGEDLLRV